MNRVWKTMLTAACACLVLVLTACNTSKGFGEDMDSLGENISGEAKDHGAHE
jgi:predicted small secreted protein